MAVGGELSNNNLVPTTIDALWQDCPYVPFAELKSEEAQARLSVCKPIIGLRDDACLWGGDIRTQSLGRIPSSSCRSMQRAHARFMNARIVHAQPLRHRASGEHFSSGILSDSQSLATC